MSEAKLCGAFGKVLMRNFYKDGEVFFVVVKENSMCTILWSKGKFKNRNVITNEPPKDFPAGTFITKGGYIPGLFENTVVGDTEVFCYDPAINNDEQIDIKLFSLPAGEQTLLPIGTKLFLCGGILNVNNVDVDKPTQIRIKSSETTVVASTDCYGLLFP